MNYNWLATIPNTHYSQVPPYAILCKFDVDLENYDHLKSSTRYVACQLEVVEQEVGVAYV